MKLGLINRKSAIFFSGIFLICVFLFNTAYSQGNQADAGKKQEEGKKQDEAQKPENKMYEKAKDGWQTSDYRPYIATLKDLEKLSREYSEFLLKRSVDEYSKGFDTLQDMQAEIVRLKEIYKNKKYLNEIWYWQEVDRKNAQDRYINRLKIEAKTKSITYFTRAINTIDEIKNNDLKNNETFIDFKSKLFRIYVSTQYDLGNMKPCIPILERYITMREENRKDIWAYKYLSSCYAVMEAMLDKAHKTNEEDIIYYKNKKNQCLLTAAELQYGIDSPEFKELQKIVQQDERTAEVINIK